MTEPQAPTVTSRAAGEGKRMKPAKPKVRHERAGRTMPGHAVTAAQELGPRRLAVVVGKGRELVAPHVERIAPEAAVVVQDPQNGTGQAARLALEALTDSGGEPAGTVLVLLGDGAMVTGDTLRRLIAEHEGAGNAVTDLTAVVPDPTGLGRVLREPDGTAHGRVIGIVEQKDCTPAQATIHEVNSGIFAFDPKVLRDALGRLTTDNAQGEELLTDVMAIAVGDGLPVGAVVAADHHEVLAANDRAQLADLRRLMNQRITRKWMVEGVTIIDPATTWIDVQATLEPDATLRPNTQLEGATHIASGADVGPNSALIAPAEIGDGAYGAAGSVLTLPVGPGELAVARGKQRNIAGYVARKRPGSKAAQAAARAVEAGAEDDRETNTTGGESGERG